MSDATKTASKATAVPLWMFRECPGHEGYAVDASGGVWSRRNRKRQWRRLTPTVGKNGYLYVGLQSPTRNEKHYVHTLVLEAFVEPRPAGMECRHLDGNRANARLSNLQWGTPKQNTNDKRVHGTFHIGSRHGNAKLTEADVLSIRKRVADGCSRKQLAAEFGVHKDNITHIVLRNTWKHVG